MVHKTVACCIMCAVVVCNINGHVCVGGGEREGEAVPGEQGEGETGSGRGGETEDTD